MCYENVDNTLEEKECDIKIYDTQAEHYGIKLDYFDNEADRIDYLVRQLEEYGGDFFFLESDENGLEVEDDLYIPVSVDSYTDHYYSYEF